jgi:hypothetical protein
VKLRSRLRRLEKEVGPLPDPPRALTPEELVQRLLWWLQGQTYGLGVFDDDPEFRPAWSRYHRLWEVHTQGWSPLHAVWLVREQPDFEEARWRVVPIMIRLLRQQPSRFRGITKLLLGQQRNGGPCQGMAGRIAGPCPQGDLLDATGSVSGQFTGTPDHTPEQFRRTGSNPVKDPVHAAGRNGM